ncbi:hypothetical protein K435DRAFT_779355 [Dendrothele bispora CBS 962.96]|uniref:Uncharacterized protein n=1 Tax=Dendrothele bispora (strain CBS 962.96) TaxID=1314807 RepID=A0A4S8LXX1_DENBC|nr:hypothetical protein K435DRAFT_779355 [Dendrothele bispora CBS 962.96]
MIVDVGESESVEEDATGGEQEGFGDEAGSEEGGKGRRGGRRERERGRVDKGDYEGD